MNTKDQNNNQKEKQVKIDILERYSFTLPNSLVEDLDKLGKTLNMNRSMIVREALSRWIIDKTKDFTPFGDGVGISSYIYDHHDKRVVGDIMHLQHNFDDLMNSVTHIHLNHEKCLEIAFLRGELKKLKILNDDLRSIKGISFFSDILIPTQNQ